MSYSQTNGSIPGDGKRYQELPSKSGTGNSRNRLKKASEQSRTTFCLKFAAFVFSHVGLGALVLFYTIGGAFLFKHFEESSVPAAIERMAAIRNGTVNKLWTETYKLNVLYKENWTTMATKEIELFQQTLVRALKDGEALAEQESRLRARWSFADSWMYSISIITTIGYANRPVTPEGKVATVLYALFGIPIMLLFLSTLGNLLGKCLRTIYNFCCFCTTDQHRTVMQMTSPLVTDTDGGGHGYQSPIGHVSGGNAPSAGNATNTGTLTHHLSTYHTHAHHNHSTQQQGVSQHQQQQHHHHHHHHVHEDYQLQPLTYGITNGNANALLLNGQPTAVPALVTSGPFTSVADFGIADTFSFLCAGNAVTATAHSHPCPSCLCGPGSSSEMEGSPALGRTSVLLLGDDESCRMAASVESAHHAPSGDSSSSTVATTTATASSSNSSAPISSSIPPGPYGPESVPLYFCFLLILLYLLAGASMFYLWEGWSLLDGVYFCFVTLSTIGTGEIIPERTLSSTSPTESRKRIVFIVIYILGGMALIAMSFNSIYEQLAYKLRRFGAQFQHPSGGVVHHNHGRHHNQHLHHHHGNTGNAGLPNGTLPSHTGNGKDILNCTNAPVGNGGIPNGKYVNSGMDI